MPKYLKGVANLFWYSLLFEKITFALRIGTPYDDID